ncbi:MAG: Rne/Rng family ribonuclease [Actinomycetota bacterium]
MDESQDQLSFGDESGSGGLPQQAAEATSDAPEDAGGPSGPRPANKKRRRGSRGGKRHRKPAGTGAPGASDAADEDYDDDDVADDDVADEVTPPSAGPSTEASDGPSDIELPDRMSEGRPSVEAAETALVRRPRIGDTRPAPVTAAPAADEDGAGERPPRQGSGGRGPRPAAEGNRERSPQGQREGQRQGQREGQRQGQRDRQGQREGQHQRVEAAEGAAGDSGTAGSGAAGEGESRNKPKRNSRGKTGGGAREAVARELVELDAETLERRRGRERNGRPVGRYMMAVHVGHGLTQVAVMEGRNLIEHYVSRPAEDVSHIHGNIYVGRVQNVLPGMEACFVDIATPKNAVLYAGDVQYDAEDIVERSSERPRIEQILKNKQLILCQVTKNPIGMKGARLTQEVSLPGRFVVLIPNSKTYGISKRLPDDERKRLRSVLDRVKEPEHGLIVRTAAENATEQELRADVQRLNETWRDIERRAEAARRANRAQLLYREPDLAVRVIREEFNADYRSIAIDDRELYEEVRGYIEVMNPELADRVEFYDVEAEGLPLYERFHVHEQLHKALDRKVWLPSGGSLIIEHTEALSVIDVNTGRNVGTSSLEATVLQNNLEAAEEIARQLRLRDIGGIIVIDFIDMEIKENRRKVVEAFRNALSRDKTRSQVFDISELGLVEMTRKRIGEGLLQSFATQCPHCVGRGVGINTGLLD